MTESPTELPSHKRGEPDSDDERARATVRRARRRKPALIGAAIVVVAFAGFIIGNFFAYVGDVVHARPSAKINVDGIVVLTGGSDRIARALALLPESGAKRLLISGVHPKTTRKQIAVLTESHMQLFDCCVDLDRKAMNTVDNALETAKWAREKGFDKLLVVTSAYHMPRSLIELQSAMPDVELTPYPVVRDDLDLSGWYMHLSTTRLLLREYVKYMVTRARTGLGLI